MYEISPERAQQRRVVFSLDAQIELDKLGRDLEAAKALVRTLRARFKQFAHEAELGLRLLLDGGPPLAHA